MPPKKATADGETPTGLTDGELRFIKAVFDNMTQKPDADWTAVARDLSLKDAKCAKERFRQMSVRHGWREQTATSPASPGGVASPRKARVTKRRATPRKKVKKDDDDDEEEERVKSEEDTKPKEEVKAKEEEGEAAVDDV